MMKMAGLVYSGLKILTLNYFEIANSKGRGTGENRANKVYFFIDLKSYPKLTHYLFFSKNFYFLFF
ncbi:hypothetical protein GGR21_004266 [Dysgonomonas hofstadii]|uniref:Uncharacterized protein n=1 Tax=Dysgonomonas hofstadii TaxID=637886 RepID=A0A840D124_9BACT|nr:hypothetical protein [Dysgonomonas hofstadii]